MLLSRSESRTGTYALPSWNLALNQCLTKDILSKTERLAPMRSGSTCCQDTLRVRCSHFSSLCAMSFCRPVESTAFPLTALQKCTLNRSMIRQTCSKRKSLKVSLSSWLIEWAASTEWLASTPGHHQLHHRTPAHSQS